VPVVMGGFHATLAPDEVARYAEAVVVGEAEGLWEEVLDDAAAGTLRRIYRASERPSLAHVRPDRSIFRGKRYLPVCLIEAGRGCRFKCDFCAVQTVFAQSQTRRPLDAIIDEVRTASAAGRRLIFFVDDNVFSTIDAAKELLRALIPLRVRWVSQASINAAHDEEFLDLLGRSGCMGLLIGFESLNADNLRSMSKGFNLMAGGPAAAMANLRRHGVRIYGTFIFGYAQDTPQAFSDSVRFAREHAMYIAAFNHLTPFPGTPLYGRLEGEGRLLFERWWLDETYRYNMVPFRPSTMPPEELQRRCLQARRDFYSVKSILERAVKRPNRSNGFMLRNFPMINLMQRRDVGARDGIPLGDASDTRPLIPVC
jgi:radical SAM superfamily enzyme YgiQ (UPF0313 family)